MPPRRAQDPAASDSSVTPTPTVEAPWLQDVEGVLGIMREEVASRFGTVDQRLEDNNVQLAGLRSDLAALVASLNSEKSVPATEAASVPSPVSAALGRSLPPHLVSSVVPSGSPFRVTPNPLPYTPRAPWSDGPGYKQNFAVIDDLDTVGRRREDPTSFTSPRVENSASSGSVPAGIPKGYTIKTSDIGTFDGTSEDLELFIARVEAISASESDAKWRQAVLRAMPLLLRGHAASWHQTLEPATRASLITLPAWFRVLRESFSPDPNYMRQLARARSPDPNYMRQLARARSWQPDQEDVVGYVLDKTALLKAAFIGIPDSEIVYDVLASIPVEIRKQLSAPQHRSLIDVRNELRMQEQFWREERGRPLIKSVAVDSDVSDKPPRYASFAGPPLAAPATSSPAAVSPSAARRAAPASAAEPRRPSGKPISEDFDGSRLSYGIEPKSKKVMMRYPIPGTDRIMWCQRSCDKCGGDHFNFAHDHCARHTVPSLNTVAADDAYGYLVTTEGEDESTDFC
ncbi:unnamed protein product [Tilletia controversa]|nr:unnamed protein product [Tilletia controversa]